MSSPLSLILNGRERSLEGVGTPSPLTAVLTALDLRADRVAIELNGELAPRSGWAEILVHTGDRLEIVHFVGGGRGDLGMCPGSKKGRTVKSRAAPVPVPGSRTGRHGECGRDGGAG